MANEEKVLKSDVVEEEIKVKKPSFIDKLHDFRLLNILYAIGGGLAVLFSVLFLVFFQIDRLYMGNVSSQVPSQEKVDAQILGFVVFTIAVIVIIIGALQVYNAFPYIMKKDKLSVKKWYGYMSLVLGVLSLVMLAFCIVNMVRVGVHRDIVINGEGVAEDAWIAYRGSLYFWIPMALLNLCLAVYSALVFVPILSVKVYLPEFKKRR